MTSRNVGQRLQVLVIHPFFSDEMYALIVVSFTSFSVGFLGFAYTSIMEDIAAFSGQRSTSAELIEAILRTISPSFLALKALFTLLTSPENTNLWARDEVGQSLVWLAAQSGLCLLVAMARWFCWIGGLRALCGIVHWLGRPVHRCVMRPPHEDIMALLHWF
jgi:hypothetical protein